MKKFFLLMFLCANSHLASAQAIWVNYSFKTNWGDRAAVAELFKNYLESEGGQSFSGRMYLVSTVINGPNPSTHNAAFVYKNEKDWEARRAALFTNANPDFSKFISELTSKVEFVDETVFSHVAGFGLPAEQTKQWFGVGVEVKNLKRYKAALKEIEKTEIAEQASFDLWAVTAGGSPGITHYVTVGVESRADFNSNEAVQKAFAAVESKVSSIRKLKGINYGDTVFTHGPLKSEEYR